MLFNVVLLFYYDLADQSLVRCLAQVVGAGDEGERRFGCLEQVPGAGEEGNRRVGCLEQEVGAGEEGDQRSRCHEQEVGEGEEGTEEWGALSRRLVPVKKKLEQLGRGGGVRAECVLSL